MNAVGLARRPEPLVQAGRVEGYVAVAAAEARQLQQQRSRQQEKQNTQQHTAVRRHEK
jgi:hypothetical protein